jgi:hypothetical protein
MPAMGVHARRLRLPAARARSSFSDPGRDMTASGVLPSAEPEDVTGQHDDERRGSRQSGVTHRSPSGDSPEMPCCGRMLSEVPARDRVTTNPTLVTCHG